MLQALAEGVGGLGLFFAGMYLLSENLKKLTGRRFRETVAAWTTNPLAGFIWGFAAGAMIQSTSAITFILASMLASGLLTVRSALPIVIGANVGGTLLVIIAALDIQLFVLAALGLAGLSFASERLVPVRTFALSVFGIGLIFLGLHTLQAATGPLAGAPWVKEAISGAGGSYLLIFAIALVLSFVTQSSVSIALLAITLTTGGILSFYQTMMVIYGANVGSSVLTFVLSASLRGHQRQVAIFQSIYNCMGAIVCVPLLYIEVYAGVPLMRAAASALTNDMALQLAYVFLLFNCVAAGVLFPSIGPMARLLARLYPPPPEEDDARPKYLHDHAVQEPETALDLVGLEQRRLAGYLPRLLAIARQGSKTGPASVAREQKTFAALATTIEAFLARIGEAPISHSGYERLNAMLVVQRLLDGLDETLADLAKAIGNVGENSNVRRLGGNMVEGLDTVLLTMIDAMNPDGAEDRALLGQMTGDRGTLMRRLREEYLANDAALSAGDKMAVLTITNLSERASWLLGRLAEALQTGAPAPAGPGASGPR